METRGGKIPDYIYKQMMECMMKDWQNEAIWACLDLKDKYKTK